MASITREANGRRTIQFIGTDGKRRSIRLGKVSQRHAEAAKVRIEHLVAAKATGHAIDAETARWLATIDMQLADRLASVGLIPERTDSLLLPFVDAYIASRTDLKFRTIFLCKQARGYLADFFGDRKAVHEITPGDADSFRLHLLGRGLTENTVRRVCGRAKQFMNVAVRRKLIQDNPFADVKCAVRATPEKFYFISREDAARILDACPNAEWRLLFALSRFGGLRCPSEHLALRWEDVLWDENKIRVPSPKTEHHEGKGSRLIPLFDELRPYLEECFELAEPGAEFVISRYRSTNANLRTQLIRIIKRAGLSPWPKLFVNLRSTRETELAEEFPQHVVCEWIGNSQAVAKKHYLQVTEEHFARAVQNAVQQPAAGGRINPQEQMPRSVQRQAIQQFAGTCGLSRTQVVPPQGLEP